MNCISILADNFKIRRLKMMVPMVKKVIKQYIIQDMYSMFKNNSMQNIIILLNDIIKPIVNRFSKKQRGQKEFIPQAIKSKNWQTNT